MLQLKASREGPWTIEGTIMRSASSCRRPMRCAVDFMSDTLYGGRRFLDLNILDEGVEAEVTSDVGRMFGGPCRG